MHRTHIVRMARPNTTLLGGTLLTLLLAGCATPPLPQVERAREVPVSADEATRRGAEALGRLGFSLDERAPDRVVAVHAGGGPAAWADCRGIWVRDVNNDQNTRRSLAKPQGRRARVVLSATPRAPGATVTVAADFSASYVDRYRNTGFEEPCPSSGVLERSVLDSVSPP